jgi:hypothetical protein
MATDGQFYWPSVGNFVAAYGQFFMAANTGDRAVKKYLQPVALLAHTAMNRIHFESNSSRHHADDPTSAASQTILPAEGSGSESIPKRTFCHGTSQ